MFPMGDGPFLAQRGPFITAAGGSIALSGAAATVSGTTITVTASSSGDLSEAVFGVEYKILDNGGSLSGYTFSKNVVGAVSSQSITVTAADGVTSDSTVTVRAYYNLDVLDDPSTRVYANDIVPYVVAGGVPTGTQTEGQTLTQVQGVIAGSSPITVTYQWQNDGGTGTWANINGATSATYVLAAGDVGDDIAVVHTATNTAGATSTRSAETGAIAAGAFTDDFNRANMNLEASPSPYIWTRVDGTAAALKVVSNKCNIDNGAGSNTAYRCPDQGSANHYTQVTIGDDFFTSFPLAVRLTDSDNFIGCRAFGVYQLYKRDGGSFTLLGSSASSYAANDVVRLEASGNSISVKVNGVTVIGPVTESFNNTVTRQGMVARTDTGVFCDNFEAGTL